VQARLLCTRPGLLLAASFSAVQRFPMRCYAAMRQDGWAKDDEGDYGIVRLAAIALGVSAADTWFLRTISTRVQRGFSDKVTIRT